jgi:hypothetical protein
MTATLLFLVLFLIIPNSILLSERLILLFFLYFIIWLATLKYPKTLSWMAIIGICYLQLKFVEKHLPAMQALSSDAKKIEKAAQFLKPDHPVLTLNYSNNWLHSHISGYLGSNGAVPVLENYEAALKWFPVQWNTQVFQLDKLNRWGADNKNMIRDFYINPGDSTVFSLITQAGQIKPIPYVFSFGKHQDASNPHIQAANNLLKHNYQVIDSSDFCTLYQWNKLD